MGGFKHLAPKLWDNGWQAIIPLEPFGKAPALPSGWVKYGAGQQTRADIDKLMRDYPAAAHGVGLMANSGITIIDVDCLDARVAHLMNEAVRRHLGRTISNVGQHPKRKHFYQGGIDKGKQAAVAGACVEIFHGLPPALASQVVLFGTHPKTNRPYNWPGGSPENTRVSDLPPITKTGMTALIKELAEIAREHPEARAIKAVRRQNGGIDQKLTKMIAHAIRHYQSQEQITAAAAVWCQRYLTPGARHDGFLAALWVLAVQCRVPIGTATAALFPAWNAMTKGEDRASELDQMAVWVARITPTPSKSFYTHRGN